LPVTVTPAHHSPVAAPAAPAHDHRQAADTASARLPHWKEETNEMDIELDYSPHLTPRATHTRTPRHRRPLSPVLKESDIEDAAQQVDTDRTQPKRIGTDSEGEERSERVPSPEVVPKPQRTPRPARERRRPARYND
jgi:hypothetical protein